MTVKELKRQIEVALENGLITEDSINAITEIE